MIRIKFTCKSTSGEREIIANVPKERMQQYIEHFATYYGAVDLNVID